MGEYTTVSVKLRKDVKQKMERLGIRPSKILRKAIEDEIREREIQGIKEDAIRAKSILEKIPLQEVAESIRKDRDRR